MTNLINTSTVSYQRGGGIYGIYASPLSISNSAMLSLIYSHLHILAYIMVRLDCVEEEIVKFKDDLQTIVDK
uniref:Uncharacterized protein n=1 Tax=Glossina palpalis gambiensis TaxID=67801 RepID=A0A1B0ASR8_9MUSC